MKNVLSRFWESISMGCPPCERIALTSLSLFAFPVTKTGLMGPTSQPVSLGGVFPLT